MHADGFTHGNGAFTLNGQIKTTTLLSLPFDIEFRPKVSMWRRAEKLCMTLCSLTEQAVILSRWCSSRKSITKTNKWKLLAVRFGRRFISDLRLQPRYQRFHRMKFVLQSSKTYQHQWADLLQHSEKVCLLVVGFQRLDITHSAALNRVNATFQSRCPKANYQKTAPGNKR